MPDSHADSRMDSRTDPRTASFPITRVTRDAAREDDDLVAVEEPLEIRIGEKAISVTMRTPGDDFDLAAGFLLTEGIVKAGADLDSIRHWGSGNIVRVDLRAGVRLDLARLERHFYATSSCGICGRTSIDAIRIAATPITSTAQIDAAVAMDLPDRLRATQQAFDATGAIHAAGLFTTAGELVVAREDIGRHNAVDKVIGSLFRESRDVRELVLVVSGRAGFEVVQKAAVAGIPIVVAVGAPSSLAVELARELGMTLLGFVRDGRFNRYA